MALHSTPQFYMLLHDNQKNRISVHFHFSFINMLWCSLYLLCLSISGILCFLADVFNEIFIILEIFETFERISKCLYVRINFFNLKFLWNFVTWNIHQVTIMVHHIRKIHAYNLLYWKPDFKDHSHPIKQQCSVTELKSGF